MPKRIKFCTRFATLASLFVLALGVCYQKSEILEIISCFIPVMVSARLYRQYRYQDIYVHIWYRVILQTLVLRLQPKVYMYIIEVEKKFCMDIIWYKTICIVLNI